MYFISPWFPSFYTNYLCYDLRSCTNDQFWNIFPRTLIIHIGTHTMAILAICSFTLKTKILHSVFDYFFYKCAIPSLFSFIFVFSIQLTKGKQMFCIFANDCHNHCTLFYYFRHRALYNRRNFLHYIIPPFYVLFIIMKKNILLIVLNRLFLDNVKVEAFVYAEKILYVIKCIRNGG